MFDYSVTQGPSLHNCELLEKRKGKFSPQKKFRGGGGGLKLVVVCLIIVSLKVFPIEILSMNFKCRRGF